MDITGTTVLVTGANRGLGRASDVRLLINNASTAAFADPLSTDRAAVEQELQTNYLGTLDAILAFAPVIERNGGGAVVNVLSLLSLASMPPMAGCSASKAAAHSMTQALRPGLGRAGSRSTASTPGGIDTDMLAGFDVPKAPPADVAKGILDGIAAGREDIFPDPTSEQMSVTWLSDPKAFERAFSGA